MTSSEEPIPAAGFPDYFPARWWHAAMWCFLPGGVLATRAAFSFYGTTFETVRHLMQHRLPNTEVIVQLEEMEGPAP